MVAAAKLKRHIGRKSTGRFLVEGPNLVRAAVERQVVCEVFATAAAAQRFADLIAGVDAPVRLVTERAAQLLSDTVTPAGLVAVCRKLATSLTDVLSTQPRLLAMAVGIAEPGNAGTMIRLADAMGAAAVILAGNSVDPYNAKCLRASAGSAFAVPLVVAPDPAATISALTAGGLRVLAAAVDGEVDLDEVGPLLAAPTAWLFGSEAHGLPADIAALATRRIRIPMAGRAESLNVAGAAAICLYASSRALHAPRTRGDSRPGE